MKVCCQSTAGQFSGANLLQYVGLIVHYGAQIFLKSHWFAMGEMSTRDRPRFFDQVGHQTTNASIGNKHFFTK